MNSCVYFLVFFGVCFGVAICGEFDGEFCTVQWTYDKEITPDIITFTIGCDTNGWVGLGISLNGTHPYMSHADLWIGWVLDDGTHKFVYAKGPDGRNGGPIHKDHDEITILDATEVNNVTRFVYQRKLDTGKEDDFVIEYEERTFLWAMGAADPEYINSTFVGKDHHKARGIFNANVLDPNEVTTTPPSTTTAGAGHSTLSFVTIFLTIMSAIYL